MAAALLEVEQKMRKVDNFKQLHKLKKAIKGYLERKLHPHKFQLTIGHALNKTPILKLVPD